MFIVPKFSRNEQSVRNESLNDVSQMSDRYAHRTKYDDFLRPEAMELFTWIPTTPCNTHRVGNIYILVHKTRQQLDPGDQLTYTEEKRAHHSLMIDVAGESNDMELRGVSFHLSANVKFRKCVFNAHSHPVQRSSLLRSFKPEPKRLHPPANVSNPRQWVALLEQQVSGVLEKTKDLEINVCVIF